PEDLSASFSQADVEFHVLAPSHILPEVADALEELLSKASECNGVDVARLGGLAGFVVGITTAERMCNRTRQRAIEDGVFRRFNKAGAAHIVRARSLQPFHALGDVIPFIVCVRIKANDDFTSRGSDSNVHGAWDDTLGIVEDAEQLGIFAFEFGKNF